LSSPSLGYKKVYNGKGVWASHMCHLSFGGLDLWRIEVILINL
jgi:hypothetical protein